MAKLLLLLIGLVLSAQAALVTISETAYAPSGSLATGTITCRLSQSITSAEGLFILPVDIPIAVTKGVVNQALQANTGASPANTSYKCTYDITGMPAGTVRTWIIPATGPRRIIDVESSQAIVTASTIALSQIGGVIEDAVLVGTGGQWTAKTLTDCPSGAVSYTAATNAWGCASALTNPMTSVGDMIRGGTAGAPTRVVPPTDGQLLTPVSGIPAWTAWNTFNAKAFGCVGDGVANDTTCLTNALTALPATGGALYLPSGTYLISSTLTISKPNVTLFGYGDSSTIKAANSAGLVQMILVTSAATGFTLRNVILDGNRTNGGTAAGTAAAVLALGGARANIERSEIKNGEVTGIFIGDNVVSPTQITIRDNYIHDNGGTGADVTGIGIFAGGTAKATFLSIINNRLETNYRASGTLGDSSAMNLTADYVEIRGNYLLNNLNGGAGGGQIGISGTGATIANNIIRTTTTAAGEFTGGIEAQVSKLVIADNVIAGVNSGSFGIKVFNTSSDAIVSGNTITGNSGAQIGIDVDSSPAAYSKVIIANNRVVSVNYCIHLATGVTNITVVDNDLESCAVATINNATASPTFFVRDNKGYDPQSVNAQTGTTYTYVYSDRSKLVTHTNAGAIAGTLPVATTAGFDAGWLMDVENRGAGTLTITPTTSTIDGAANLALTTNQGVRVFSDGTNYFTMRGVGAGGAGTPAGSGTEIQYRLNSTTFGAVTGAYTAATAVSSFDRSNSGATGAIVESRNTAALAAGAYGTLRACYDGTGAGTCAHILGKYGNLDGGGNLGWSLVSHGTVDETAEIFAGNNNGSVYVGYQAIASSSGIPGNIIFRRGQAAQSTQVTIADGPTQSTNPSLRLSNNAGTVIGWKAYSAGHADILAQTAPGTPAAGDGRIYVDSTSKNISLKDDAGVIKHGVQSKSAVTSNFLTAISDAGVVSTAQPSFSDISGLTTEGDMLYRDATGPTRLARGTNGQCLTSNATTVIWGSCAAGSIGGSGTANTMAKFTAATTIGNSSITDDGTTIGLGTNASVVVASGLFSKIDGITTAGVGMPIIGWISNVTAQSTSQSTVTLATAPTAGSYRLIYYADQNALCTTGANSVSFSFNWSDATNARVLNTGSMSLGTAQQTNGYLSGEFPIFVGSGNVTYTSTVQGTCASGTSTFDIHASLERIQ